MPNTSSSSKRNLFSDMDRIDFNKKVAVVTGAGSGLGKSYAIELSKRGARVVVNDFGVAMNGSGDGSIIAADEVVSEIKKKNGQAVANYDNVASVQGGLNVIQTALDAFGTIDIIINNAGILRDRSFAKMTYEDWKFVIDVHLNGTYNITYPAFKIMKNKGYGRIVMVTSGAGLYGNFGQTNYSAAKMAIVGMMNSLKLEGEKHEIKINAVAPIASSRLTKNLMPDEILTMAKPDLVASLVLYLCSEQCQENGNMYNVGMGYASRVAVLTGSWSKITSNNNNVCSPEDVRDQWLNINNMNNAKEFKDFSGMFLDFMKSWK